MRDIADYSGREQEFVKHTLLEKYLPQLGFRVGRSWDDLIYIDGFAGPWQSKDAEYADASFGVAVNNLRGVQTALREHWKVNVNCKCIFVEKESASFKKLDAYAKSVHSPPSFEVNAVHGAFVDQIPDITTIVKSKKRSFKFVFVDPKGWADIPIEKMRGLLSVPSTEVLINLMTSHITRFLDQDDRVASYNSLFGRKDVLEKIRNSGGTAEARAEAAVREYCISLRELCNFKYVSEAVILEPQEEKIRYFLIYATNHTKGVSVFKEAERTTAILQTGIRNQKTSESAQSQHLPLGHLLSKKESELGGRYTAFATAKVLKELVRGGKTSTPVSYNKLFCEAMAFPYVTPNDLRSWIANMGKAVEIRYEGGGKRRSLSEDKNDFIIVRDRASLENQISTLSAAIDSGKFLPVRVQANAKEPSRDHRDDLDTFFEF